MPQSAKHPDDAARLDLDLDALIPLLDVAGNLAVQLIIGRLKPNADAHRNGVPHTTDQ